MTGEGVVAVDDKRVKELRRKAGWRCVDCRSVTSAVNDVGEPQCPRCQRELHNATATARAMCACGEPMLAVAERCGFCLAERAARVGAGQ